MGNNLTIADLKLYWIIDWLTMGILDGIPKNLIDGFKNVVNWRNNITAVREARLGKYGNRGLSPIVPYYCCVEFSLRPVTMFPEGTSI